MISTAYQKLYHVLHGKIIKEEYKPGDKLPTEKELCELYGVSRITSRHALRLLQEEGLVERFPGKGTFISGAKPKKVPIFNNDYVGSIKTGVPNAHREILELTEKTPPGYIADHLGLFKPEKCFFAVRVDFRNNEPIAYDRSYLPLSLVSSITKEMFIRIDFLDAWIKSEGISLSHIWESVEAVTADKTAQEIFSVSKNAPMLLTTDIIYIDSGRAVGVFETFYRGDQFKLISTVNKPQRP